MQSYLKDAMRNLEIKIFKAELFKTDGEKISKYFTSRLELGYKPAIGTGSVYEKLMSLRNILNATNETDLKEFYSLQNKDQTGANFPENIASFE